MLFQYHCRIDRGLIMIAHLISHRSSPSECSAARVGTTERARRIIGTRLKYIAHSSFDDPTARDAILAPLTDSADDQVSAPVAAFRVAHALAGRPLRTVILVPRAGGSPVPEDELPEVPHNQLREQLNPACPNLGDLDEIDRLQCEAVGVKTGLSRPTCGWLSLSPRRTSLLVTTCPNVSATATSPHPRRGWVRFR